MTKWSVNAPLQFSNGDETVKIYTVNVRDRLLYQVCYYRGGRRQRKNFSSLSDAKRHAKIMLGAINQEDQQVDRMTIADMQSFVIAQKALETLQTPLHIATETYAKALEILSNGEKATGSHLLEACEFYRKHHPQHIQQKPFSELIQIFVESRKKLALSYCYVNQSRINLNKLEKFCKLKSNETPSQSQTLAFLETYSQITTRNNKLRTFLIFGNWLVKQNYATVNPFEKIEYWKEPPSKIEIYTPKEMSDMLAKSPKLLIPYLAIGGFAGLRTAEIARLDWKEVNLERNFITVAAEKAKTAARRIVPIQDNLKSWLLPHAKKEGRIIPYEISHAYFLIRDAGCTIKHNALRHSYISYRLAQIHDTARVALECGNSPDMIFRHYRELVSPEDGEKWFSICLAKN